MADSPIPSFSLAHRFQATYELFVEFARYVSELHAAMPLRDEANRAACDSLTRLRAFTEQMTMLLNLMQEDVRVTDELTSPPVVASWNDQIDQCFLEWLRAQKSPAPPFN